MLKRSSLYLFIAALVLAFAIPVETTFAKSKKSSSSSSSKSKSSYKSVSSSWKKPSSSSSKTVKPKPTSSGSFYSRSTSTTAKPKATTVKPKVVKPTKTATPTMKPKPATVKKPTAVKTTTPKKVEPVKKAEPIKPAATSTASGFSKPSASANKTPSTPAKPTSSATPPQLKPRPQTTKFDYSQSKKASKASRDKMVTERSRFAGSSSTTVTPTRVEVRRTYNSHPVYNRYSRRGSYISYNDYYVGRDRYYRRYGWEPPYYVYQSRARFGVWDSYTWWYVLDNLDDPAYVAMAYHHRNDPGYREWRREVRRLSFNNPDLRYRMDRLDDLVRGMNGRPIIPGYLPEGMEPEVAIAADIAGAPEALEGVVRLTTAQPGGNYFVFGQLLRSLSPEALDVEVVESAGSLENLQKLDAGEVEVALAQSDILGIRTLESETSYPTQAPLWDEFIHIIANAESGVSSIQDLDPAVHTVCIGLPGSGSVETWRGFVMANEEKFGAFQTRNLSVYEARNAVLDDPNTVMLYVAGLGADFMYETDQIFGDALKLVSVNVPEFTEFVDNDGNQVYSSIPLKLAYPKLQSNWSTRGQNMNLAVTAVLVLSPNSQEKIEAADLEAFTASAQEAKQVLAAYRGN